MAFFTCLSLGSTQMSLPWTVTNLHRRQCVRARNPATSHTPIDLNTELPGQELDDVTYAVSNSSLLGS